MLNYYSDYQHYYELYIKLNASDAVLIVRMIIYARY